MKFTELNLSENILVTVEKAGLVESSPIQGLTIPLALEGKNAIGQAQTGTGKTAAFGLPALDKIDTNRNLAQVLVTAPIRGLAVQGQEELFRFGHKKGVEVCSVYGGSGVEKQIKALRSGAHIVVGTSERLLDLIKRKALKLDHVKTLILDEADEVLDMRFSEDIEAIISRVPETHQAPLFSAIMPEATKRIGVKLMQNLEHVKVTVKELTTDLVDWYYTRVKEQDKFDTTTRLTDANRPELSTIFERTKCRMNGLTRGLGLRGYHAEGIHGDPDQGKHLRVLRDLRNDNIDTLVATDVAACGSDVSGVAHVCNHDIPQDPESHAHRTGRIGRTRKHGRSITLAAPGEMGYLSIIKKLTRKRMKRSKPVTVGEASEAKRKATLKEIERDFVDEMIRVNSDRFKGDAVKLAVEFTPEELTLYILNLTVRDPDTLPRMEITRKEPLPFKPSGGGLNNRKDGRGNGHGHDNRRGGCSDRKRDDRDNNDYRDFRRTSSKSRRDFQNRDNRHPCCTSSEKKTGFVTHNRGGRQT